MKSRYVLGGVVSIGLIFTIFMIQSCSENEWMEVEESQIKVIAENTIEIKQELSIDEPFFYVCFYAPEFKISHDVFSADTKVLLMGEGGKRVALNKWARLFRKNFEYTCALFNQNYGVTSHFYAIEITSTYVFSIKKIFFLKPNF